MGALRACYVTPARAYIGGPEVRIRWYFAEPGAPFYQKGHVFSPVEMYEDKVPLFDVVGEIPYRRRPFWNGDNPGVNQEPGPCGTEADYLGQGTVPRLPNGQLDFARFCGCAYRACIGWEVLSHFRARFNKSLALECQYTARVGYRAAGVGELVTDGAWGELPDDPYVWHFRDLRGASHLLTGDDTIRFAAEDSENCGGENDQVQTATAWKTFIFDQEVRLTFTLNGRVEKQNPGFETLRFFVDGVPQWERASTELGGLCTMQDVSDTITTTIPAGLRKLKLRFSTEDERYHVGAFWQAVLSFDQEEAGELVTEGEWSELVAPPPAWDGELCTEGEWEELPPPGFSGAGELVTEGEWSGILTRSASGDGEVVTEGEWDEPSP